MLLLPALAMSIELFKENGWIDKKNYLLATFGFSTLLLEFWMIIEALLAWPKVKGLLENPLPEINPSGRSGTEGGRSC